MTGVAMALWLALALPECPWCETAYRIDTQLCYAEHCIIGPLGAPVCDWGELQACVWAADQRREACYRECRQCQNLPGGCDFGV